MFGKKRIQPGWRYTLAQFVLSLLFGRKQHFISPWAMSAVGVAVVIVWKNKVLYHRRRGNIEGAGKWGGFGGYMDLETHESMLAAMARELWEESQLRISTSNLDGSHPDYVTIEFDRDKLEMAHHDGVGAFWFTSVSRDIRPLMQETEEACDFTWLSEAQLDALWRQGQISGTKNDHYAAAKLALRQAAKGKKFPPLKLAGK